MYNNLKDINMGLSDDNIDCDKILFGDQEKPLKLIIKMMKIFHDYIYATRRFCRQ